MRIQNEVTVRGPLLDNNGMLNNPGYATQMMFDYNAEKVANPLRLKEWDFYQFNLGNRVLQMTLGHVTYCTQIAVKLFSVEDGSFFECSRLVPLKMKDIDWTQDPEKPGRMEAAGKDFRIRFDSGKSSKRLRFKAYNEKEDVDIDLRFPWNPKHDKMVIATPFDTKGQFYLNYKEHYFNVEGHVRFGDFGVLADGTQTGLMDWGRGVWPYHNEWFWGCGNGRQGDGRFGFNIGWGFGNTDNATENMFFWNGKAYKLGDLQVDRNPDNYMAPWRFYTLEGDFDLTMTPVYDHYT